MQACGSETLHPSSQHALSPDLTVFTPVYGGFLRQLSIPGCTQRGFKLLLPSLLPAQAILWVLSEFTEQWELVGSEGVGLSLWFTSRLVLKYLGQIDLFLSGLGSPALPRLGTKSVSESKRSSPSLPIFFLWPSACDSGCAVLGVLSKNVLFHSSSSRRQITEFLPRFLALWLFWCISLWHYGQFFVCFHIVAGI